MTRSQLNAAGYETIAVVTIRRIRSGLVIATANGKSITISRNELISLGVDKYAVISSMFC